MQTHPSCRLQSSRVVLCLVVSLLFWWVDWIPGESLQELADKYQEAKREYQAAVKERRDRWQKRGVRKAQGSKTRRGRPNPKTLEQILIKIARMGSEGSLKFLSREYSESDPAIIQASARALLESGHEKAIRNILQGFNRSGNWTTGTQVMILDALVLSSRDEGLEFVLKTAKTGRTETQILALGSLALLPEEGRAFQTILQALGHRVYEVRNAALRALKGFRWKEMVPALIGLLGREKDDGLRLDTLQLLVDLTGVNMGFVVEDWEKWWDIAKGRFEFQKEEKSQKKKMAQTLAKARDLQYFGIEVVSDRVAFLVDASNSMLRTPKEVRNLQGKRTKTKGGAKGGQGGGKRKIDILKEELTRILRKLPGDSQINIIYFDLKVISWKKELHFLRGNGREEAISFVRGLNCAWGTNIYDSLELALNDRRVDTIFLLSDGQPVGGKFDRPDDILREIGALNRVRGAKINCISFGVESKFLKDLAAQNGGVYRVTDGS